MVVFSGCSIITEFISAVICSDIVSKIHHLAFFVAIELAAFDLNVELLQPFFLRHLD